jgi:hypothetical protein
MNIRKTLFFAYQSATGSGFPQSFEAPHLNERNDSHPFRTIDIVGSRSAHVVLQLVGWLDRRARETDIEVTQTGVTRFSDFIRISRALSTSTSLNRHHL